ncbi:MAG: hypothetical protein FJ125_12465 [Deltaproteobacteria bacterium]|nr:hypothetical protein [Deltaproteobacteria bacterium]
MACCSAIPSWTSCTGGADLRGNLAEWIDQDCEGKVDVGGHFFMSQNDEFARCYTLEDRDDCAWGLPPETSSEVLGFRCCRDPDASEERCCNGLE